MNIIDTLIDWVKMSWIWLAILVGVMFAIVISLVLIVFFIKRRQRRMAEAFRLFDEVAATSGSADVKTQNFQSPPFQSPQTEKRMVASASESKSVRRVTIGHAQHIGKREEQQDAYAFAQVNPEGAESQPVTIVVLADGMGGTIGGREAAVAAIDASLSSLQTQLAQRIAPDQALYEAVQQAQRAVERVNDTLAEQTGEADPGAGSTICAVIVCETEMHWISLGDSRIYYGQSGSLQPLTVDDNYGMELDEQARQGLITAEAAQTSNERHMLTGYLGSPEFANRGLQTYSLPIQTGDRIFLCSDGVYGSLNELELHMAVQQQPQAAADQLVEQVLSKDRQYQDNMTAVIVELEVE
jgi:protein phosphatase